MENSSEISNRFRAVLLNGKWIANTNYKDAISALNWKQATYKTGTLNTIATLTQHLNYYIAGVLNVLNGGSLDIKDAYSFDFLVITSEEEWQQVVSDLLLNSEKFATQVAQLSNKQLENDFVTKKYGTYRRNIEAMIEHAYYHLGQISLLKKIILEVNN